MPPVNPQGSRGTLITAVVIFTILFVVATVFAIYFAVDDQKQKALVTLGNERSARFYSETTSQQITDLLTDRTKIVDLKDRTAIGAAIYRIEALERQILGNQVPASNSVQGTLDTADSAVAKINTDLQKRGLPLIPTNSLVDAVTSLKDSLIKQQDIANNDDTKEQQVVAAADVEIKKNQATLAAMQEADTKSQADRDAAVAAAAQAQKDKDDQLAANNAKMDDERRLFNERLAKADKDKQALNAQITSLTRNNTKLIQKLATYHPNPSVLMVRRSQGHILNVASEDIVYIDLGKGEQIVPGMTFEVYNKHDGVPPLGDGMSDDNTLPTGEASIEVQQVLDTSSQCRVTKLEPGQHITEGDIIANLVYDRNTKYNFVVYGKFNLNPDSPTPTVADADIIKGLIVKWGGKIQDHVDVDTDFVVMGAEPKVEDLTADQLTDPFVKNQHDKEVAEQAAYAAVLDQAKDLSITFMNQNRFLYYTGYYALSAR